MQNELFKIDNPCIGVCAMNKKGYCMGCLRNRNERQTWHTLSDADKAKILKILAKRRRKILEHRHTQATNHDETSEQLGFLDE